MAYFRQSKRRCALFLETVLAIPASASWMVKLQNHCTQSLQQPYQELCAQLPSQKVIRADESPTQEQNRKSWLWVFVCEWMTVFAIRPSRGGEIVDEFLTARFKGVVICDRYKSYYHIGKQQGKLQWCWSHLLRDFQSLADSKTETVSALGERLVTQAKSLFRVWHRFRDGTISETGYRSAVGRIRQSVTTLLKAGLRGDHARTSGMCQEILQHREWLWTFLDHPEVELTNNASERALRHGVIWRKLSFGTQSESGSRFVGTLLTVIETCRQQKRSVFAFVTESVQQHFAGKPAPSLLLAAK
jgi:transposase